MEEGPRHQRSVRSVGSYGYKVGKSAFRQRTGHHPNFFDFLDATVRLFVVVG